jgi:hypothetical protein
MEMFELLSLGLIVVLIVSSVWLAFLHEGDPQPASAGVTQRLLYPSCYLNPSERTCPSCGGKNPATAVRCLLPTHVQGTDDDLSLEGEVITTTGVRVWVLRVLFAGVTSSLLLVGLPPVIYAAVAATALWILLPLMACQDTGRRVFLIILVVLLVGIGVVSFLAGGDTVAQLTTPNPTLLPHLAIGPLHVNLSAGVVTPAAVWLNTLSAIGALGGVLMSTWSQLRHRADDYDGVMTVAFMGTLVGALLLMALSSVQRLDGLAQLYRTLAVVAFGWLLVAFVERAIVGSFNRARWSFIDLLPTLQLPTPGKPRIILRPSTARGTFATFMRAVQVLVFGITRGAVEVIFTLLNLVIGAVNLLIKLLVGLVNTLVSALIWLVRYLIQVLISLLRELVQSFPALYRLGTAGFRVALYGPALMLGASMLFALCTNASTRYLAVGNLGNFAAALVAFAGGAIGLALAATFYVDWSILRSFSNLLQDYVPNAIIYFAIYLDLYGVSRLLLRMPSHFGLVSVALNVILGIGFLVGLVQQLAQRSAS